MANCINCSNLIKYGTKKGCPNCGAEFCACCAEKTKNICPNCYYDLELKG